MKIISIVLLLGLLIAPNTVWGQTVTEKAKAEMVKEKQDARVREAKRLLTEKKHIESRIVEINDRLNKLDKGAEPDISEKITYYNLDAITCCVR